MALNKKTVDDINAKGKRVLVRCDFNVPLKAGEITDDTRIKAALPTIKKLLNDGGKVILCSHLGKVKNGPNEGESLAPVAKRLEELLGQKVNFVSDYNVTGEAATKAVEEMKEGEVVLLQNTRFRGAEETKNGEQFSKELADLADIYVCDAFGSSHRAHASVAGVTKFITAKGGQNVVGYLMEKEIAFLGNAVENPVRPFVAILGGAKVADKLNVINNLLEKCDTLIIGGGMAYTFIKAQGYEIGLSLCDDEKLDYCKEMMEKAEKLGKKLFITGKGRCNFTNAGDEEDIRQSVVTNPKFMYSAFKGFSNYDVMGFFDELGLKFKIERGNRCFPESDHSSDVISALAREMRKLKVNVLLNTEVLEVLTEEPEDGVKRFSGVKYRELSSDKKQTLKADDCIIATGGNSYSSTGSTGDGYRFAKSLSHTVTPVIPALVPLTIREEWASELMGLSLKNISISIKDNKKEVYSDFGEMLFTHFGVSGPVILSGSSYTTAILRKRPLKLIVDLKPALSEEQLDERILRDFSEEKNKAYRNSLDKLLPKKLIPVIVRLSDINKDKKVNEITKQERLRLVHLIKNLEMIITGTRGFNEAIITQGGVNVKEINPSTMESKLVKGVYFAGEVLDVDAVTGGFNLQVAWSSAYAAATHIL